MAQKSHKKRQKKGHSLLLKAMLITLLLLVILAGATAFAIGSLMSKVSTIEEVEWVDPESEDFEVDEDAGEDSMAPEEVEWPEDEEVETVAGTTNILIIGQDTRTSGARERSDSMILVSINSELNEVNMISFMRDLYVQIPGYSDNRINAAYQFGGATLLDEVLEKNFGVTVDYNVEVDFSGFQDIIDLLGGVDITLTETEASYFQAMGYSVTSGSNHVMGEFALTYARTRYVSTATESYDFGRTQRQRAVITSIFSAYKDVSVTDKISILYQILDLIATDIPTTELLSLVYQVQDMNLSEIGSYRIPADGTYTNQTIRQMSVLVPDLTANRTLLQSILNGTTE